ncbi:MULTISPECIES: hypothetical protein [Shewanella]|uniref:hypothetical protein n=1 Tax=Shewanella TaxID=22 RepID=UPI003AAD05C6
MKSRFFTLSSVFVLLVTFVSACSSSRFQNNADDIALAHAAADKVKVYTSAEIIEFKAQFLGDVSTSYCENSSNPAKFDELPSLTSMTDSLKLQVYERGGNAIVMKQCGIVNYPSCVVYFECNGDAYAIDSGF